MDEELKITGLVTDIIYANSDNGYTVCEIESSEDGSLTATGYMPYLTEGENVCLTGVWTMHPEYGDQFKVSIYESVLPSDEQSVLQYLSSGIVAGVGAATAKRLVERFGADTLNIMLTEPKRLSELKGISEKKALKIGESYAEVQSMQSIILFLQKYRISPNFAMRIHRMLGSNAVERIMQNPYILAENVEGVSFKTSDHIAFTQGLPKNSSERLRSGIKYILSDAAYANGHVYMPKTLLIQHTAYKLGVDEIEIENALSALALDKDVFFDEVENTPVCYLSYFYEAELYVARRIISLSEYEQKYKMSEKEIEAAISEAEKQNGITLAHEQRDAAFTSVQSGFMVLTGGPGTGKTTVIKTILSLMKSLSLKIALAAPTGRAAKRLTEMTGVEAKTIHRLLGTKSDSDGTANHFTHNETNPLSADVIIIDEASMIDLQLMHSLLRAAKTGAKVILAGDADQLPSVGPGNVLRDIISCGGVPVIRLDHIFRQAEKSLIVVNAHKINRGEMPDLDVKDNDFFFLKRKTQDESAYTVVDLCKNRLPKSYHINPISQIQVLAPAKKGAAGVIALNSALQEALNPPNILKPEYIHGKITFRKGDKVMQTKNNYDIPWTRYISEDETEEGQGVYNGDMGIVQNVAVKDKQLTVIFDDDRVVTYQFSEIDQLDLSYAITVHKSQGSEFAYVVLPVCMSIPALTFRNLFYTAITRAKIMVILVGSERVVNTMVQNNTQRERYSGLCEKMTMIKNALSEKAPWEE